MDWREVKQIIENYDEFGERYNGLARRIELGRVTDPIHLEQSYKKIDEASVLNDIIFSDDVITYKEYFIIHYRIEGRTYEEIAELYSITAERVRQMIVAASKKIAKAYNDEIAEMDEYE